MGHIGTVVDETEVIWHPYFLMVVILTWLVYDGTEQSKKDHHAQLLFTIAPTSTHSDETQSPSHHISLSSLSIAMTTEEAGGLLANGTAA